MKSIKKQAQKGFTMIELVIVIAVLGILAAFALPRFADFTTDAKNARANSVAASINVAMGIAKTKYLANGGTALGNGTTYGVLLVGGSSVLVNSNGDLDMNYITSTASPNWCSIVLNNLINTKNTLTAQIGTVG